MKDIEKLMKSRDVISSIIDGKEPYSDNAIDENSFLNDPRMLRCMAYIVNVLTEQIESNTTKNRYKKLPFYITAEEIECIDMPEGEIGINAFCTAISESIDLKDRKKLSGVALNKKLKKMGILEEATDEQGKRLTVPTDKAINYGIKTVKRSFNGRSYEQIVYDESGKRFLLDHLQEFLKKEA